MESSEHCTPECCAGGFRRGSVKPLRPIWSSLKTDFFFCTYPKFDLAQPVFPLKMFGHDFQPFSWMGIGRFVHFLKLSFCFHLMIFLRKEIKMETGKAAKRSKPRGQDAGNRLFIMRYGSKSCFSKWKHPSNLS
jgi:hypothetical protein